MPETLPPRNQGDDQRTESEEVRRHVESRPAAVRDDLVAKERPRQLVENPKRGEKYWLESLHAKKRPKDDETGESRE